MTLLASVSRLFTKSSMVIILHPRDQHDLNISAEKQTVAFNIKARVDFKSRKRARMGIWQAMEMLNTLVDDSDPDVGASLKAS